MTLDSNFTNHTLTLLPDYEGEVTAVLLSCNANIGNRKSILYLHGYIDYFFHPHVAQKFIANGYDFYALDMRKHGRALLPHQHPNYCKSVTEYFEEISLAITHIQSHSNSIFLLAHSTGGLTASCYMNQGKNRNAISGLILNSPFLDFNLPAWQKEIGKIAARIIAPILPYAKLEGALSPAYAQSVHKSHHGQWDFNLDWKPINGFPTYFAWIVAITNAQSSLRKSNIGVPILILHSSGSAHCTKFEPKAMNHDIVLNVSDIMRVGVTLGAKVTLAEIQDAQHDVFLSPERTRNQGFNEVFNWLNQNFN